jgi:undecaprenyl-diphosphatase
MDATFFALINGSQSPGLDEAMLLASALGKGGFLWFTVAAIAAVFPRHRMAACRVVLSVGMAYLLADGVVKPFVSRPRPFEVRADARLIDQRPVNSSFPSGHSAAAAAGAFAASRLLPAAQIVWWVLAVAIAVSRVYVGAHWPSDAVFGLLIGIAAAWFALGGRAPRPVLPSPPAPAARE